MDNAPAVERGIKKLLNFRMSLIPYLYNAFADYRFKGTPPFRALVMDYPDDKNTFDVSDEYLIGESLLAAPLTGDAEERKVYLPAGNWYDFNSNKKYAGGATYVVKESLTDIPIFVKEGAILPLAAPVEYVNAATKFEITCYVYGNAGKASLFEDDGITYNFEKGQYNMVELTAAGKKGQVKRVGNYKNVRYEIRGWGFVE